VTRPEERAAESSASDPLPPAQASGGVIAFLVGWGPLLFGVGFLAPLIAQTLDALALEVPIAPSNLAFGLGVGTLAGLVARARGSWI
jgi:hypothetical protein